MSKAEKPKIPWSADSKITMTVKKGGGLWVADRSLNMTLKESVDKNKK